MADKNDILLKEYETCQKHNDSLGQQAWVSISIIITVNLIVLTQVVLQVVLTSHPDIGWARLTFVSLLGVTMSAILWIFRRWDKRIDFMKLLNNERMRQIETVLGMWKNWRVYGLDLKHGYGAKEDYKTLLDIQKKYIDQLNQHLSERNWRYRPPTDRGRRFWNFDNIPIILIILWGLVIVLEALTYCPAIYHCLFN